ncbi:hypothetical protein [Polymorphospora lycopeni]|uniref:Uncharacterized protein n=1 Tax=Polymorphospora lycopeni TaxID=3140240 RepID=A0ABV5D1A8_9ACTN
MSKKDKNKSTVELVAQLIARQQPTPRPDLRCEDCQRESIGVCEGFGRRHKNR